MRGKEIILNILNEYKDLSMDYDVYVVADIQKQTALESSERVFHADESEFFSREEFAEIASAIFYVFGFVKVFYSEISFIEYVIKENISPEKCFVYNFARDGQFPGKKSLIPSFCDLFHIKYTGSDAFTISLLRNKSFFTDILKYHNILVPNSVVISPKEKPSISKMKTLKDKKIIVKNICESASIGLSTNSVMKLTDTSFEKLIKLANTVNHKQVLIQEYIKGLECEVLVLKYNGKYHALNPVIIDLPNGCDYIDSDISNSYDYNFRLLDDDKVTSVVCNAAEKAATVLRIKDYARFDFKIHNGTPYLFDIAGTPYTIYHSSIAYLFKKYNLKYEDIYKVVVACMFSNYSELS